MAEESKPRPWKDRLLDALPAILGVLGSSVVPFLESLPRWAPIPIIALCGCWYAIWYVRRVEADRFDRTRRTRLAIGVPGHRGTAFPDTVEIAFRFGWDGDDIVDLAAECPACRKDLAVGRKGGSVAPNETALNCGRCEFYLWIPGPPEKFWKWVERSIYRFHTERGIM